MDNMKQSHDILCGKAKANREMGRLQRGWLPSLRASAPGRAGFEFWLWHLLAGDHEQMAWPPGMHVLEHVKQR